MKLSANWIWSDDSDGRGYNLCSVFHRDFQLEKLPESAVLRITADSYYRLLVNGRWIVDGPCRSWPEHYRYDKVDIAGALRRGTNRIEAVVRYFGCGTFHQLPQRAGFLAQLDCGDLRIVTDETWNAAPLAQWVERTVKSSCQQSPVEIFDATRPDVEWRPASVVAASDRGPWRDLRERDCPLLTRQKFPLRHVVNCSRVMPQLTTLAVSGQKLMFPGDTSMDRASTFGVILAMTAVSSTTRRIRMSSNGVQLAVNGIIVADGEAEFRAGENLIVAVPKEPSGLCVAYELGFPADAGLVIGNPWDDAPRTGYFLLTDCAKLDRSTPERWANTQWRERCDHLKEHCDRALTLKDASEVRAAFPEGRALPEEELLDDAAALSFENRCAEPVHPGDVENADHLIFDDGRCTTINPVEGRDIEICCDLGEQNIGYWEFSLFAAAGTIVDLAAVEYIAPDGRIQHTLQCRNIMRYICRDGYNHFTSFRRRGGRYIFLTLRNFASPVRIRNLRLVESTYPVVHVGKFICSDDLLNRIYGISQRTLKLCMEDTFTDCPLYEQTLWIGDARSESLFAMSVFGAYDLVRRCIRLAGQSLERFPLIPDQLPSGWSAIIPIWSFMWCLSVADYCNETGDVDFPREIWPMFKKLLDNADRQIDESTGLFISRDRNFFDWGRTNTEKPILLYNSFFLVGALDAGIRLAARLGEAAAEKEFRTRRTALISALDRSWDTRLQAWPDSLDENGAPCAEASVHTSMLAILFDAVSPKRLPRVRENTVSPPPDLIKPASPFASFYYYQALEKLLLEEKVIENMRKDYLPMLEYGSTTVWETYPDGAYACGDFPTRSHCHAWSAAPLYFFPRLVLGIRNAAAGGTKFVISPHPGKLEWARGARPTIRGRIEVEWRRKGKTLDIKAFAPEGVELVFERNNALNGLEIRFNGNWI